MPLGIQRLNAKRSPPNDRIVFIKPLKGPDEAVSQDFLERVAAQCLPIMREHHLTVMSLEEYEPNAEFVGRNFNAGEVIQLVLKARFTGHWLPFNYVQMVMMHELAHCRHMNHSKAFWAVRNQYADHMRILWRRGYLGEGLWGRGALLGTGEWEKNTVQPDEALPEHLCGGTYRSRGRKRRARKAMSYKEQKERRILKKFGANGVALGEDEETKKILEKGRRVAAKPRVAGSARGRELRAAAALARFEQQKKEGAEEGAEVKEEGDGGGSETVSGADTESEEDYEGDGPQPDAMEADGTTMTDRDGRRMVKVCEDEDPNDQDAQNELLELQSSAHTQSLSSDFTSEGVPASLEAMDKGLPGPQRPTRATAKPDQSEGPAVVDDDKPGTSRDEKRPATKAAPKPKKAPRQSSNPTLKLRGTDARTCPVCSFANDFTSTTCGMCANVLDPDGVAGSWRCQSRACAGSSYLNAGDCGVCGICHRRRPQPT